MHVIWMVVLITQKLYTMIMADMAADPGFDAWIIPHCFIADLPAVGSGDSRQIIVLAIRSGNLPVGAGDLKLAIAI